MARIALRRNQQSVNLRAEINTSSSIPGNAPSIMVREAPFANVD
jgi:hypothetical protein